MTPIPQGIQGMADPAVWIWATVTMAGCAAMVAASLARWGISRELAELRQRIEAIERYRN